MALCDNIKEDITSNCSTQRVAGLEKKSWIFIRKNHTITYDNTDPNKVTSITNALGKKAYSLTSVKNGANAGSDRVVKDNRADMFKHYFGFDIFEITADASLNVDAIEDIFVVVEQKTASATGEGKFIGFGLKQGMWPTSDTERTNENDGVRRLELTSTDTAPEPFSKYIIFDTDYATTLALLDGCLVVGV